jgi:hypothetical protein
MFTINTNNQAPVFVQQEILIDAHVTAVWNSVTTIDQWPSWQKNVRHVAVRLFWQELYNVLALC